MDSDNRYSYCSAVERVGLWICLLSAASLGLMTGGCERAKNSGGDTASSQASPTTGKNSPAASAPRKNETMAKKTGTRTQPSPSAFQRDGYFRVDAAMPARVGSLRRNAPLGIDNPSEFCLEDGFLWRGAAFRLDGENIFGVDIDEALAGKTVIVYGESRPSLDSMLERAGKCPEGYGNEESSQQLRSDWTSEECGFNIGRSTHARLREISYLDARGVFAVEMIKHKTDDGTTPDMMTVEVHNPFGVALTDAEVVSHYEGGRGKPRPRYDRQKVTLQPGERKQIRVTLSIPEEDIKPGMKKSGYKLHDISLAAMAGNVKVSAKVSAL